MDKSGFFSPDYGYIYAGKTVIFGKCFEGVIVSDNIFVNQCKSIAGFQIGGDGERVIDFLDFGMQDTDMSKF